MTTIERPPTGSTAAPHTFALRGTHPHTVGVEHVPRTGGAVLAMTHFGRLEFALVKWAVWRHNRRRIRFLVKREGIRSRSGALPGAVRRIAVDMANGPDAYAEALEALRHGELVGLFPEAGASDWQAMHDLKIGAALLALEADVPLIPVVVWDGDVPQPEANKREGRSHRRHRFRTPAELLFGAPIPMSRSEDVRAVTDELRAAMQRMVHQLARPTPSGDR